MNLDRLVNRLAIILIASGLQFVLRQPVTTKNLTRISIRSGSRALGPFREEYNMPWKDWIIDTSDGVAWSTENERTHALFSGNSAWRLEIACHPGVTMQEGTSAGMWPPLRVRRLRTTHCIHICHHAYFLSGGPRTDARMSAAL